MLEDEIHRLERRRTAAEQLRSQYSQQIDKWDIWLSSQSLIADNLLGLIRYKYPFGAAIKRWILDRRIENFNVRIESSRTPEHL